MGMLRRTSKAARAVRDQPELFVRKEADTKKTLLARPHFLREWFWMGFRRQISALG